MKYTEISWRKALQQGGRMKKYSGRIKKNRCSRYLSVILAVFLLAGVISGPAGMTCAAAASPGLEETAEETAAVSEPADAAEDGVLSNDPIPAWEAGSEDGTTDDEQEFFTITYSANGGGYFVDYTGIDEQYADFTEMVGAGTMICGRDSIDSAIDSSIDSAIDSFIDSAIHQGLIIMNIKTNK